MKLIASLTAALTITSAAFADTPETGTIVWDAGIVMDQRASNSQINQLEMQFRSVQRSSDGSYKVGDSSYSARHLFGAARVSEGATFRTLELPAGEYVLSSISFREGYQSFCVLEKTLLLNVSPGKTEYLGQFIINEPSGSPQIDQASYVPIKGMSRLLGEAQKSRYWKFGSASLAELKPFSLKNEIDSCASPSIEVSAW